MANNYNNMTGVLVLDKVTPVISALFGDYNLDAAYPGNGEAYIAKISESNSCTWDGVLENLQGLAEKLGLDVENIETVKDALEILAKHFKVEQDESLADLIEQQPFEDDADLDVLFTIARFFDDGHGLKAYKTEESWRCDRPRLFEFGGAGAFTGLHVSTGSSSGQAVRIGETLEAALAAGHLDTAAEAVRETVDNLLAGIRDETARTQVRSKLAQLLAVTTTPDASPQEVYQGYLIYQGIYIDVSFEAPVGATPMEKDAAYTAALAQKAEIEYLAIGTN